MLPLSQPHPLTYPQSSASPFFSSLTPTHGMCTYHMDAHNDPPVFHRHAAASSRLSLLPHPRSDFERRMWVLRMMGWGPLEGSPKFREPFRFRWQGIVFRWLCRRPVFWLMPLRLPCTEAVSLNRPAFIHSSCNLRVLLLGHVCVCVCIYFCVPPLESARVFFLDATRLVECFKSV